MNRQRFPFRPLLAIVILATALAAPRARADDDELVLPMPTTLPDEFKNSGVTEHLNSQVPGYFSFTDEHGQPVNLQQYFKTDRPVVLQLGYYACPMLCDVISRSVIETTRDMGLKAGADFEYVFVSIDPGETPDAALLKKQNFMKDYGRGAEQDGFHFLTGRSNTIDLLADVVGFHYQRVAATGQYAHPAVLMVLTPDGKISRYLNGLKIAPQTLRLSLVEASSGKIGSVLDELLSTCLQYDSRTGKYAWRAMVLMRIVCGFTALALGGTLLWLFRHTGPGQPNRGGAGDANAGQVT